MSQSPGAGPFGEAPSLRRVTFVVLLLLAAIPWSAQAQQPGYRIQVAAQDAPGSAAEIQRTVRSQLDGSHGVYVVQAGGYYKVRVGDFVTRAEASALLTRVKSLGYSDAWVASDEVRLSSAAGGGGQPQRAAAPAPAARQQPAPQPAAAPTPQPAERTAPVVRPTPAPERPVQTNPAPAQPRETFPAPRPAPPAAEEMEAETSTWPLVDDGSIRLDGRPTEPAWETAGTGWAKRPASSTGETPAASVKFAYDNQAFYIATRVDHPRPGAMEVGRSGAPGDQERVVVTLQRDGATAASFGVTLTGVRVRYEDAWDDTESDWQARTAIEASGWSSEIRVPFELLGVDEETAAQQWEVSVRWEDPNGAPTARRMEMPMEQFAQVFDIPGTGSRFVIAPFYQASTAVATASPSWETPTSRVGGTLEADLGEAFQAKAEVQPDYLNTRPDQARVNLSPYETRFTEHRPFFQGLDADQNAWAPEWGPSLFYSRRIGSIPGLASLPSSVETLVPSDVLGVAAFQGETGSARYQAVTSMTRSTTTTILDGTGTPVSVDLSPQTFLGAGRVEHRVSPGATVGGSFTGVHRSLAPGDALSSLLADQAFSGLVDLNLAWAERGGVQLFAGVSHLMGTAAAMQTIQTGSGHYLQRPDADHVSLDPTATSLTGFTGGLRAHVEQSGVRFEGRAVAMNPEYDIQDAGFMRSADRIDADAWLGWGHDTGRDDGEPVGLEVGAFSNWNFGGVRLQTSPAARVLVGYGGWEGEASFRYDLEGLSDDLTRGGPLMATPAGWLSTVSANRAHDRGIFRARGAYGSDDLGGTWIDGRILGSAEMAPGFTMWVEPGYMSLENPRQYVMAQAGGAAATYGQRYVFGALDQTEVSTRVGLDLQLRYGLSLSAYAEPFVSSGSFAGFGELTAAQENSLLVYGTNGTTITTEPGGEHTVDVGGSQFTIPASDFNVRSFRSQVSLGWTPIDHANVSLAWLQSRSAFLGQYDTPGIGNLLDSARDFGAHLFVARVGYALGLPR